MALFNFFPLRQLGGSGVTPPHLYFQSAWLVAVLKMAVNNSLLRWTMHEGDKYGVDLWSWLKIKYEIADKLDSLWGENEVA